MATGPLGRDERQDLTDLISREQTSRRRSDGLVLPLLGGDGVDLARGCWMLPALGFWLWHVHADIEPA